MKMNSDLEADTAGGFTKLQAALSGQTWLLSIANCVQDHPQNFACRMFELGKLLIATMSRVRGVVLSAEEELMFNDKVSKYLCN